MTEDDHGERRRLGAVVLAVLISQVLLYPGVPNLVVALGAPAGIDAGMWFLVAEFGAFVTFAVVWGAASDALGRRAPLIVAGALGGAASYIARSPQSPSSNSASGRRSRSGRRRRAHHRRLLAGDHFADGPPRRQRAQHGNRRGRYRAWRGGRLGRRRCARRPERLLPRLCRRRGARGAGLLAATVDDKVVTDRPADASGAQNDVGFRDVLAQARTTHGLFVPLAFGFVDRLTAGFFALVGVYYFQDPETFGLSAGAAGATLALFFVPFAVLQAPFGSLSDRVGRFLPVVLGSIAYGIVTIGVGVAPVYPVAAALMVLVGVCGALMAPATMALVTDLVEPEARGAAMGLFNVFGSLGFLAGFLIGGSATDLFGYTPAFLAVGGLELAIALALFPAVRSIAPGDGLLGLGGGTGRSPSERLSLHPT